MQREAAIVAATAGTTRDVIEAHIDLGGYPILIADTAGLRETADAIEAEGVRRAQDWARGADLKLVLFEAGTPPSKVVLDALDGTSILVANKIDLVPEPDSVEGWEVLPLSVKTGAGIAGLVRRLTVEVSRKLEDKVPPVVTRARHRQALEECRDALSRFGDMPDLELAAEDLRIAGRALGRITGAVEVDEILDRIFREFCIGK